MSNATGFMHTGQRDQIWCRISKKSFKAGLRLKHLGIPASYFEPEGERE